VLKQCVPALQGTMIGREIVTRLDKIRIPDLVLKGMLTRHHWGADNDGARTLLSAHVILWCRSRSC
jgi:hypothetical protein